MSGKSVNTTLGLPFLCCKSMLLDFPRGLMKVPEGRFQFLRRAQVVSQEERELRKAHLAEAEV